LIEKRVKDLPQEKGGDNFSPASGLRDDALSQAQVSCTVISCHIALKQDGSLAKFKGAG